MTERSSWLLALASANLVVLLAGAWLIDRRLAAVEEKVASKPEEKERPPKRPAPSTAPTGKAETLDGVVERLSKLDGDLYEDYSEIKSDLYQIRQTLAKIEGRMKRLVVSVAKPGQPAGSWGLAPQGDPLPAETVEAYRKEAEAHGVHVSEGRVEVRGFLNMAPDRAYPIEYFVTRWPESGHETLIHVVGSKDIRGDSESLVGLLTALYKGLVVAGFEPGTPSAYMPAPDPKKRPIWVAPKGDVIYVGARYRLRGQTHVAKASDWVVDPGAEGGPAVLPEDCWRFTGGLRTEDPQNGDDMLSVEMSGKAVSVYQDPNTLVEIADPSNVDNDYQYNFQRIPRPEAAIVLGESKDGLRLFARIERKSAKMTVLRVERGGKPVRLSAPPVLLVEAEEGAPPVEKPFTPVEGEAGAFSLVDDALKDRLGFDAKVRLKVAVDGSPVLSTGTEPFWLDLILSKTPIVPEGDGAKPMEKIQFDEPVVHGGGQHGSEGGTPPPPPPPTPEPPKDGK